MACMFGAGLRWRSSSPVWLCRRSCSRPGNSSSPSMRATLHGALRAGGRRSGCRHARLARGCWLWLSEASRGECQEGPANVTALRCFGSFDDCSDARLACCAGDTLKSHGTKTAPASRDQAAFDVNRHRRGARGLCTTPDSSADYRQLTLRSVATRLACARLSLSSSASARLSPSSRCATRSSCSTPPRP